MLEQIGAHHAYAKGLTGRGIRIGIEDTVVDYTQSSEFGNRVRLRDEDGASLAYSHPLGDQPGSDASTCAVRPDCAVWTGNSEGDEEAANAAVRRIVEEDGWPVTDDSVFVLDEHYGRYGIEQLLRWWEVPSPYDHPTENPARPHVGSHGTSVASTAAGTNLGVAPEATIIPVAVNLTDDQFEESVLEPLVRQLVEEMPAGARTELDANLARDAREDYGKFDIINQSYGFPGNNWGRVISDLEERAWLNHHLPNYVRALLQSDRAPAERTILVRAAGNDEHARPEGEAAWPTYIPELRGHTLAVAATDPSTMRRADYSSACGPLPADWNATAHGPTTASRHPGRCGG